MIKQLFRKLMELLLFVTLRVAADIPNFLPISFLLSNDPILYGFPASFPKFNALVSLRQRGSS